MTADCCSPVIPPWHLQRTRLMLTLGRASSLMFRETCMCTCTSIVSNYKPRFDLQEPLNVGVPGDTSVIGGSLFFFVTWWWNRYMRKWNPRSENSYLVAYSALHNKPELPFFAKLVCATLFRLKMEIRALFQSFVSDCTGKRRERYIRGSREVHSNIIVQVTLFFEIFDLTCGPVLCPTKENQR